MSVFYLLVNKALKIMISGIFFGALRVRVTFWTVLIFEGGVYVELCFIKVLLSLVQVCVGHIADMGS